VELNVAEDWISRCVVDGEAKGSKGLQAQFGDNVLILRCTNGVDPSCGGQTLFFHFTCVKCTVQGINSNAASGEFVGCLTADCNSLGLVNGAAIYAHNNVCEDATALAFPGGAQMSQADMAFADWAGNDFRLLPGSLAWFEGMSICPNELLGWRKARETFPRPRVYAGCYDPYPPQPSWLTGGSSIRNL
jgi:hypothetical protein